MSSRSSKKEDHSKLFLPEDDNLKSSYYEEDPQELLDMELENDKHYNKLLKFLENRKDLHNPKSDPSTTIMNISKKGGCYKLTEQDDVTSVLKSLENCRRSGVKPTFSEKQLEYSGIMLDLDIYQDIPKSQLNSDSIKNLLVCIVEFICSSIKIDSKEEDIYACVTKKKQVVQKDKFYKDGIHIIIPGIQVTKDFKKWLILSLKDNSIITKGLGDFKLANNHPTQRTLEDCLDKGSASVPVSYIGCRSKPNSQPYEIYKIYQIKVKGEEGNKKAYEKERDDLLDDLSFNIVHEFSLNWEANVIKKKKYEPLPKVSESIIRNYSQIKSQKDVETDNMYGELSMLTLHDAESKFIKNLLDLLNPERADNYDDWFSILCILANTSESYKSLAEYFSRKSTKFNQQDFENKWNEITISGKGRINKRTLGTLVWCAKQDDPEGFDELKKCSAEKAVSTLIYTPINMGSIPEYDIAHILFSLLRYKYVTDIPKGSKDCVWYEFKSDGDEMLPGEIYKWSATSYAPISLRKYIEVVLYGYLEKIYNKFKKKNDSSTGDKRIAEAKILAKFAATVKSLRSVPGMERVITACKTAFNQCGFSELLDKNPYARGVSNGILLLSNRPGVYPKLIHGFNDLKVSVPHDMPYIPFNPYDEKTKEILITLRRIFPDNEGDSFRFFMSYLAMCLDSRPKPQMFGFQVASGGNSKSTMSELTRAALGNHYAAKIQVSYLTDQSKSDAATPNLMMLKNASFVYMSESECGAKINVSKMKDMAGGEHLTGRGLFKDLISFKPKCLYLVTSNHDMTIDISDYAIWRRVFYINMKVTFYPPDKYDPNNTDPNVRLANSDVIDYWPTDKNVIGRYMGILAWYNYQIYAKYKGKIRDMPHPHIQKDTFDYMIRQDKVSLFLAQKLVKLADPNQDMDFVTEGEKYVRWMDKVHKSKLAYGVTVEGIFSNSSIKKYMVKTFHGTVLRGHRFLDVDEISPNTSKGEQYASDGLKEYKDPEDNYGIPIETPEQYWESICSEWNSIKHIISTGPEYATGIYDTDLVNIQEDVRKPSLVRTGNNIESKMVVRKLEEANFKQPLDNLSSNYNLTDDLLDHDFGNLVDNDGVITYSKDEIDEPVIKKVPSTRPRSRKL